jgi:hypothetical protein
MRISYQQKCMRCKKNHVLVTSGVRYPLCYDCQKDELHTTIKDKKMKRFFDVPEQFYQKSSFLRAIKINYFRFGKLSDKQMEFFTKTVKDLRKVSV